MHDLIIKIHITDYPVTFCKMCFDIKDFIFFKAKHGFFVWRRTPKNICLKNSCEWIIGYSLKSMIWRYLKSVIKKRFFFLQWATWEWLFICRNSPKKSSICRWSSETRRLDSVFFSLEWLLESGKNIYFSRDLLKKILQCHDFKLWFVFWS